MAHAYNSNRNDLGYRRRLTELEYDLPSPPPIAHSPQPPSHQELDSYHSRATHIHTAISTPVRLPSNQSSARSSPQPTIDQGDNSANFEIAQSETPLIYASGPNALLDIKKQTGTDIELFSRENRTLIRITGNSREARDNAKQHIQRLLSKKSESTMVKFVILESQGGLIIGPGGLKLEDIKRKSGASILIIRYDPTPLLTTVTINGDPRCVCEAAKCIVNALKESRLIRTRCSDSYPAEFHAIVRMWTIQDLVKFYKETESFVEMQGNTLVLTAFSENALNTAEGRLAQLAATSTTDRKTNSVMEMFIPDSLVGWTIGKHESTKQKFEEETGARIIIPRDKDGTGKRRVQIQGSDEQTSAAKSAIEQHIERANQQGPQQNPNVNEKQIRIPSSKALSSVIIGKKGSTVRSTMDNSGANIWIDSVDRQTNVIRITGGTDNITKAVRLIHDKLRWTKDLQIPMRTSVPTTSIETWGSEKYVEFFSNTGCILEQTNGFVEINGFDNETVLAAKTKLQELMQEPAHIRHTSVDVNQTTSDLGGLHIDHEPGTVPAIKKISGAHTAQIVAPEQSKATSSTSRERRLCCDDIAHLVNQMLETWSSDELMAFKRETFTSIEFDFHTLVLTGFNDKYLRATREKLLNKAHQFIEAKAASK